MDKRYLCEEKIDTVKLEEDSLERYLDWVATDVLGYDDAWEEFVRMLEKRRDRKLKVKRL